jgi:hypothetical protein
MLTRDLVRHPVKESAIQVSGPAPGQGVCRPGDRLPGLAAGTTEARLALLRADYARLITAARASVAAVRTGAANPLVYVEAELARHCGLPAQEATVPAVLADAATAMALAGAQPGCMDQ